MNTILDTKIRYMERKSKFYETETEQWLQDHKSAQRRQDHEVLIRDLNRLINDMFDLDCIYQKALLEDSIIVEEFDTILQGRFTKWLEMAIAVRERVTSQDVEGYYIAEFDKFNNNIREVEALLNPSSELSEKMAQLRDHAIVEQQQGHTIEGLVD